MVIDKFEKECCWLSNFHPALVVYEGDLYKSVEHAYQAAKTTSDEERARIQHAKTAGDAKRLGRRVTLRHVCVTIGIRFG